MRSSPSSGKKKLNNCHKKSKVLHYDTCWWRAWWRRRHWRGRMRAHTWGPCGRGPRIRCSRIECTCWVKDLYWRLPLRTILPCWWCLCWCSISSLRLIHCHWRWLGPRWLCLSNRWWSLWKSTVVWTLGRRWSCLIERLLRQRRRLGYLCLVSRRIVELRLCRGSGGLIRRI